ncbi:MAG: Alpha/beta hydrolase family protein [Lentisphaerae bacterium ADurb.Bin242]|nr:MAG: Alpha/beta hydrolase family protein [Lentisphaerae bacterium ADurb.Bin242]
MNQISTPVSGQYAFERFKSFSRWKRAAKGALTRLIGLDELLALERKPIVPEPLWKRKIELGTIEKIAFESEPGFRTFAYVCLPKKAKAPCKTFICLQGHSTGMHTSIAVEWKDETTPKAIEGDRDFAIGCLQRGIAAVCLEQRCMGEHSTNENREPSCFVPTMIRLLGRRTTLAERIYDVDRLVDYLYARKDIDRTHIGLMGNSGGGTTTMFAGALLDRITHSMPSCSFSSFRDSIGAMQHCACNYIPGLLLYGETADAVGLTAPKPVVVVNGVEDPIFPIRAANEQFERMKKIYAAAGAPGNCVHAIGKEGHRFYAKEGWDAMSEFFLK